MSLIRRVELVEPYSAFCPSVFLREASVFGPRTPSFPSFFDEFDACELGLGLDLVNPIPSAFELFDNVTDLIRVERTPSFSTYRRVQRVERLGRGEIFLERLSDRVSELESRFDRLARIGGDRKYTWTAEVRGPAARHGGDQKYKLTAVIKDGKKERKEQGIGKSYKWTAEIEGKGSDGPISRTYTFKAATGDAIERSESKKKDHKKKRGDKEDSATRVVLIEEPSDHRAVVLRQVIVQNYISAPGFDDLVFEF